jgi:hypothetical protein
MVISCGLASHSEAWESVGGVGDDPVDLQKSTPSGVGTVSSNSKTT